MAWPFGGGLSRSRHPVNACDLRGGTSRTEPAAPQQPSELYDVHAATLMTSTRAVEERVASEQDSSRAEGRQCPIREGEILDAPQIRRAALTGPGAGARLWPVPNECCHTGRK
jgi:hypothetical protein